MNKGWAMDENMDEDDNALGGISQFPDDEELVITKIERGSRRERGRYIIHFGPLSLTVLEDVMIKYRMTKGNSFIKKDLEEIILADEKQQGYVQALRYLERQPRTRKEIAQRLSQKELGPGVIDEVLARLEREKLVDDDLYARQWARQRMISQRKGKMWIRQELHQKGIDKTSISEALGEISEEEEWDSVLSAGKKKWNQVRGDLAEKKRKTFPFLMRRGYSGDLTRRVIQRLIETDGGNSADEEDSLMWD